MSGESIRLRRESADEKVHQSFSATPELWRSRSRSLARSLAYQERVGERATRDGGRGRESGKTEGGSAAIYLCLTMGIDLLNYEV